MLPDSFHSLVNSFGSRHFDDVDVVVVVFSHRTAYVFMQKNHSKIEWGWMKSGGNINMMKPKKKYTQSRGRNGITRKTTHLTH